MKLWRLIPIILIVTGILAMLTACGQKVFTPEPGSTLAGLISMERAKSASIALIASADGSSIETVQLFFTELKCEGFSAGSYMSTGKGSFPITDGSFTYQSDEFGEINGTFTSPTNAEGIAHLAFFNGQAECGTWDWTAEAN